MENNINNENEPVTILPAIPSDAEGINHVAYEAWLTTYPNKELGITKEDIEGKVKDRLSLEGIEKTRSKLIENNINNKTFVAKYLNNVVGFCTIVKEPEYNQLRAIYILPDLQDKGIGYKLPEFSFELQ